MELSLLKALEIFEKKVNTEVSTLKNQKYLIDFVKPLFIYKINDTFELLEDKFEGFGLNDELKKVLINRLFPLLNAHFYFTKCKKTRNFDITIAKQYGIDEELLIRSARYDFYPTFVTELDKLDIYWKGFRFYKNDIKDITLDIDKMDVIVFVDKENKKYIDMISKCLNEQIVMIKFKMRNITIEKKYERKYEWVDAEYKQYLLKYDPDFVKSIVLELLELFEKEKSKEPKKDILDEI